MKKVILIGLCVLVVGVAVGLLGFHWYVASKFTPASVVAAIESQYACRAHVGSVEVSVFQSPARVELGDFRLLPPDGAEGMPFETRAAPPDLGRTGIVCVRASATVPLHRLLRGELVSEAIAVWRPVVRTVVARDGKNTLAALFEAPAEAGSGTAGVWDRAPARGWGGTAFVADGREADAGDATERFNIEDIPIPARLGSLVVSDGTMEALLEESGAVLRFLDLQLGVSDLDIDPADLANHNSAEIALRTDFVVDAGDPAHRFCRLALATDGEVVPFEPATGYLNPDMVYTVTFGHGSFIHGLPFLEKLGSSVDALEELGVSLESLGEKMELGEDVALRMRFVAGRTQLAGDATFPFGRYSLTLREESWFRSSPARHDLRANVTASREVTESALGGVEGYLREKAGDSLAKLARGILLEPLLVEGQISLDFRSRGELGDPSIRVENPLKDLGDVLEEAGKSLIKEGGLGDLLQGLFGK